MKTQFFILVLEKNNDLEHLKLCWVQMRSQHRFIHHLCNHDQEENNDDVMIVENNNENRDDERVGWLPCPSTCLQASDWQWSHEQPWTPTLSGRSPGDWRWLWYLSCSLHAARIEIEIQDDIEIKIKFKKVLEFRLKLKMSYGLRLKFRSW